MNNQYNQSERSKLKIDKYNIRCFYRLSGEYKEWENLSDIEKQTARKAMLLKGQKALKDSICMYDN